MTHQKKGRSLRSESAADAAQDVSVQDVQEFGPAWKQMLAPLFLFFVVGLIVSFISGKVASPIQISCPLNRSIGLQPSDLPNYAYVAVSPWNGVMELPFGNSQETIIENAYITSLCLLCRGDRPAQMLTFALQTDHFFSRPFEITSKDWIPHPTIPGAMICDLGRHLPSSRPLGGFFSNPVVNGRGIWGAALSMFTFWQTWLLVPLAFIVVGEQRRRAADSVKHKKFAVLLIGTLFFTVVAETLLNQYWAVRFRPDVPKLIEEAQKTFIYLRFMRPDPSLMIRYTLSLAVLPFLLILGYGLFGKIAEWVSHISEQSRNVVWLGCIAVGIVFPLMMLDTWVSDLQWILFFPFVSLTTYVFVFLAGFFWLYHPAIFRRIVVPVGACLLIALHVGVFLIHLYRESFPPEPMHLDSVYFSVTQTMVGKTLLINVNSLYGCFAVFLEPILRIIGYGIFPFTLLMSVLSVVSLVFLFFALRLIVQDKLLLIFGGLYLFFYVYVFQYVWNGAIPFQLMLEQQPYLMRFPIRTLTVFSSLFFMLLYFKRRSPAVYWTVSILVWLAPLWNLDTGAIQPIVWITTLLVDEYLNRNSLAGFVAGAARQVGVFAICAVSVLTLFTVYLFLRSGHWPDYFLLLQFLRSHAVAGYYAVPVREQSIAYGILFFYAVGLFYVLHCLVRSRNNYFSRVVCILSLFGFGLFTYYVNRSQLMNLYMVSFPLVMLGIVLADRLRKRIRRDYTLHQWTWGSAGYLALVGILLVGLSFCIDYTPNCVRALRTNLSLFWKPDPNYKQISVEWVNTHSVAQDRENIAFLRRNTQPGESVLILTDNHDSFYYGSSKTKSVLDLPSSVEWSQWSEMEMLYDFLAKNETTKVFVEWENIPPITLNPQVVERIKKILTDGYETVERAKAPGGLSLMRKKAKSHTKEPGV